jgi:hypothetical protein
VYLRVPFALPKVLWGGRQYRLPKRGRQRYKYIKKKSFIIHGMTDFMTKDRLLLRRHYASLGWLLGIAALLVIFSACGPAQAASGTAKPPSTSSAVAAPTLVPTFTPTQGPSVTPAATNTPPVTDTPMATATLQASATTVATATNTAPPPTDTPRPMPTATRRPPTATFSPAPPTATPKPAFDFIVSEIHLFSVRENGGVASNGEVADCGEGHTYFIKVVDRNGTPMSNILIRRVFSTGIQIPPTGSKGPGMTEDVPPAHGGDMLYVFGDTSGARFTSQQTPTLSNNPIDIPDDWLIGGGYCSSPSNCAYRRGVDGFCSGHYSYRVAFQRQ